MRFPTHLILKLEGDKIYYSPDEADYTSALETFHLVFQNDTYFRVEVISHIEEVKKVLFRIRDYESKDIESFHQQALYGLEIETFEAVGDTRSVNKYVRPLSFYPANKREPVENRSTQGSKLTNFDRTSTGERPAKVKEKPEKKKPKPTPHKEQKPEDVNFQFKVPFTEVQFFDNYVKVLYYPNKQSRALEFTIVNQYIRQQYSALVPMFIKALKTDQILVTARLRIFPEKRIEVLSCESKEIYMITDRLIRHVTYKNIFDPDALGLKDTPIAIPVDELMAKVLGKTRLESDLMDIFKNMLSAEISLHYKYLQFLAEKHLYQKFRLRFVPLPEVSFLFLLEGKYRYHFINETFNTSHATYVWHCEKGAQRIYYKHLEDILNYIRQHTRNAYKSRNNDPFHVIRHDYESQNGFEKWKEDLEKILD